MRVAGAGDVDVDGFDDLIVGARNDDTGAPNGGSAVVVLGACPLIEEFGHGCQTLPVVTPPRIGQSGCPTILGSVTFSVANAPPGSMALVLVGAGRTDVPFLADGSLLVTPPSPWPIALGGVGQGGGAYVLPGGVVSASHVPGTFVLLAFVFDAVGDAPIAATAGIEVTIPP